MSLGRWCAVLWCLCLAPPVAAHGSGGQVPGAPGSAASTQAPTQGSTADVVVNALIDKKRGDWKRAESEHVIVISKDSAAELTRVTKNLERLHFLMSRLFRHGDPSDGTAKLQVTLFDSATEFRAMGLRNLRAAQGPYPAAFADQTYYDPREDGSVLAIVRRDQVIDLDTHRAARLDCDDALAEGATDCVGNEPHHPPAARPWEEQLYTAFAQHFILTYDPAVYPRWYLDGVGALFSTIGLRGNGGIDYARPPLSYKQVFRSFGDLNVADVLTGRYLDPAAKAVWSPYHAWLLAHFFLYSDLKPERTRQFRAYMMAIRQGATMAEAARVFGNMTTLQREVGTYADGQKSFARSGPPETQISDPAIGTLTPGNAALVDARIELGTRLDGLREDAGSGAAATQSRLAWLAQVRDIAARFDDDPEVQSFAAEAACRGGHADECLADAERALARSPNDVGALAWKGVALTDRALAGPATDRASGLTAARTTIERAIALDGEAPVPLIAWFQSFTKAGERVPDAALLGMAKVTRRVPAAPAPRLYLAEELLRQGRADLARRVALIVLHAAYDSPEKAEAAALFAPVGGQPAAGH
ncbi:hypothetical protein BH10PSE14_BH10PSE14_30830 [soil metagenome]